jgi:hypothetical protein
MARLTLPKISEDPEGDQDLARLVWKHFEDEIREVLAGIIEPSNEEEQVESQPSDGK